MIKIQELVHKYTVWESDSVKSKKTVLDGISLDIPSGQFTAILGPNGSGKSTLAKHLNVLLLPETGVVWIDGKNTADQSKLWEIRESVGMVFQNPDNQIIGTSVEEDVAFGPENKNVPSLEIQKRVAESLEAVNLSHKRKVSPSRLSGGQKQRVAIAGVLADQASCIVLDEPTAMLDPKSRKEILELIHYLNKEQGITIVLITHHMDEVVDADQIILMEEGKIVGRGTPKEIFAQTDLLKRVKMDVPQVVELSKALCSDGWVLNHPILHPEAMAEELCAVLEKTGNKKNAKDISLMQSEKTGEQTPILQVENVSFSYGEGTVNECKVIDDISFEIHPGEFLALIGSSGSGKTTLIKHLNGLLKAGKGDVKFKGESIYGKKYKLSGLRKNVGMVFQYPEQQLFGRTVLADVCFGPLNMGFTKEDAEKSARESLKLVGIDESKYYVSPLELSGGQKRCVAIAGVLAMQPEILIMDEPAAGLDPETKHMIFRLIEKIQGERNLAIVLVSHHMEDVASYAERVLVLHEGKLLMNGSPNEVFGEVDRLREIGIGIPQVTEIADQLVKKGIKIPALPVTVSQARVLFDQMAGKEVQDV